MMQQIRLVLLIPKELWNGQRDQKVWPRKESSVHIFAHFWSVPKGDIECLLALAGRYKPLTGFCHKPYEVTTEPQSRAPHLLCTGYFIHSLKHTIELVKYSRKHVRLLGEQRTRVPSILTLSWRILDKPARWKVVAEPQKDIRILGLQRRIQSGARDEACLLRAFVQ